VADLPTPSASTTARERSDDVGDRWRARPWLSFGLRAGAVLVPAAAAAVTAAILGHVAPPPTGSWRFAWVAWIVVGATLVAYGAQRIVRHVLPLAVLLELSLAFPDRAPSRFTMARSAGNVRRLHERIEAARRRGVDDDPARAARQILELVAALSAHDRKTRGHSERVRAYADMLAGELALGDDDRDRLRWAALLHDIGKLRVPGRILNKAGKPDSYEWDRLQQHPLEGAAIAAPLMPWLGIWGAAIAEHHERFDGRGYPAGLAGGAISLGARAVAVADSFEVMTAARAYKKPMSVTAARRELAVCAGKQFDPDLVRSFLDISIGRLWWTVGPASWIAITPVLGWLQRSAEQVLIAAKSAAVVTVIGAGAAVSTVQASPRPAPTTAPAHGRTAGASTTDDGRVPEGSDEGTGSHPGPPRDEGRGGDPAEPGSGVVDPPPVDPGDPPPPDPGDRGDDPVRPVTDVVRGAGETVSGVVGTVTEPVDELLDDVTGQVGEVVDDVDTLVDPLLPGRGGLLGP
jgi:putative nucleotidyltransferase with HDIG domain